MGRVTERRATTYESLQRADSRTEAVQPRANQTTGRATATLLKFSLVTRGRRASSWRPAG